MTDSKKAAPLASFGALVRETRLGKKLTQDRAARGAGVSRKQWALLEQGQNVSAVFIMKVAVFLELSSIPLANGLEARMTNGNVGGIDLIALFAVCDELVSFAASFAERLREIAIEAVLPASERRRDDAAAIERLIAGRERLGSDRARPLRSINQVEAEGVRRKPSVRKPTKRTSQQRGSRRTES